MNPGACILDAFGQLLAGIVGEGSPYKNRGSSTGHDITSDSQLLTEAVPITEFLKARADIATAPDG